jgi:trehalose 6-phosphate synthase
MTDLQPSGKAQLLVASNRGPITIVAVEDGDDEIRRGGGGLVSGMQTALSASPDAVWVCAAMNERERALARQAHDGRGSEVPQVADALHGDFDVHILAIDAQTFRSAYNGIANSTLWFVLHQLFDLPKQPAFDSNWRRQWAGYVRYNEAFAAAIVREAAEGAAVMVQDYHLFLVPRLLRVQRRRGRHARCGRHRVPHPALGRPVPAIRGDRVWCANRRGAGLPARHGLGRDAQARRTTRRRQCVAAPR